MKIKVRIWTLILSINFKFSRVGCPFEGKKHAPVIFLFKLNTGYSNQISSILSTVDIWMGNLTKKYCLSLIVIKQRFLLVEFAIESVIQNPLSYLHKLGPVTTFHDSFDHLVG